ncbi:unnamed protein product [Clonostachys rhizophaga]|uniref:Uncharacterized protein n=1 Tax=Clonostachys rhizophaga TaxID=160324 RepID=A0A9N9YK29_9HYPO|nr:unnamed protein product [Clonostachys rhizophaga]
MDKSNDPLLEAAPSILSKPLSRDNTENDANETNVEKVDLALGDFGPVSLDALQIEESQYEDGIRVIMRISENVGAQTVLSPIGNVQILAITPQDPLMQEQAKQELFAISQSPNQTKFSVRIRAETQNDSLRPALSWETYFNPTNDNIILMNKSDVQLSCHSLVSRTTVIINPGMAESLSPATWRMTVTIMTIAEFRVIPKRQLAKAMALDLRSGIPSEREPATMNFSENNPLLDINDTEAVYVLGGATNPYRILKHSNISSSAQSTIYLAEHSRRRGLIAIKVLHPQRAVSVVFNRDIVRLSGRWERQVKNYQGLKHKSIVQHYGHDARFLSIYMESVDAQDLASRQWRAVTNENEFTGERTDASRIAQDMSSALSYMHEHGVLHNDIKPANILYSHSRGGVLCDFGCSTTTKTSPFTGGTPYYIPPEFIGRKIRGPPSDVWALGITMLYLLRKTGLPDGRAKRGRYQSLYWLIAGVNNKSIPHTTIGNGGSAVDQMIQWLTEVHALRAILNVNDPLEQLIFKMLAPNPHERISAKSLAQQAENLDERSDRNQVDEFPPIHPEDQNPPCNTLHIGNLSVDTNEEQLKALFSKQKGYKRLCFRTKQDGSMCFVEFEDIPLAAAALYGQTLNVLVLQSINGGVRLSFARKPLSVILSNNDGLLGDDQDLSLAEQREPVNTNIPLFTVTAADIATMRNTKPHDHQVSLEELPEGDSPSPTAVLLPPPSVPDIPQLPSLAEAVPPTDSGYASTNPIGRGFEGLKKQDSQTPAPSWDELANGDADDTATQYSNFSSFSFSRSHNLIWELASDLFNKLNLSIANEAMKEKSIRQSARAAKSFRIEDWPQGIIPNASRHYVVYSLGSDIASAFIDIAFAEDPEITDENMDSSDAMDLEDRMRLWYEMRIEDETPLENEMGDLNVDEMTEDFAFDEMDEEEEAPFEWVAAYQNLLSGSEAYKWLLNRLLGEFHLVQTEPNSIQTIREKIATLFPRTQRVSRKETPKSSTVVFDLDWDIHAFFENQEYSNRPEDTLETVITLTGSSLDAQAATCAQYIDQTWPSTGHVMIELIKGVLGSEDGSYQIDSSGKATLRTVIARPRLMVEICGDIASVIEVGEQLAWLGAALRTSQRQEGVVYCTPQVLDLPQDSTFLHQFKSRPLSADLLFCQIGFLQEDIPGSPEPMNGRCWHDVFRNPVIVRGYPIRQRVEYGTGLEMPLNIMAGLVQTQQVDRFKDKMYIKGFSTMLILTRRNEDSLYWHLVYNKDGGRISYLDADEYKVDQAQDIAQSELESLRHVLGWCSEAKFYAGSSEAHHPVAHSGLPRAHPGCALAGTKVLSGRMVKDGPEFSIGSKDRPVQISLKGTIPRLKWISTKFVLLWDTLDERGWLVNGTSALLHVVRASLSHASKDPFRSAFLFKSTDMEEAATPFTANSAAEVLISKHNRNIRLYEDDDEDGGYILLKTQIDHFYSLLEKLIDHQADVSDNNLQLTDRPRRYLEGWDFEDLVTDCDPLRPRVATIQPIGKGWVDFVRDIHAVVLLGRGFGDIIRPSDTGLCEYWADLPKNQFYIASCLSDLERLIKASGGQDDHEWVTNNLICHTPSTPFMFCQCKGGLGQDHSEPVQTLFPSTMCEALRPNVHRLELRGPGAIIFGHNSTFPWIWGDTGPPEERESGGTDVASNSIGRDTDSFKDSGIGFSPGPSTKRTGTPSSTTNTRSLSGSMSELLMRSMGEESISAIEKRAYTRDRYTVGIICALSKELLAVRVLFDSRHSGFKTGVADSNQYALGEIAGHLVVAACLPAGEYGTNSAASVASNMKRSFPFIRFCLLVGIAGGAPSQKHDIRLGDVVVGLPTGSNPGVLQYDLGKSNEDNSFCPTGVLQRPPRVLTNAINALQSDPELRTDPLGPHLERIINDLPEYRYPGSELDVLVPSCGSSCESRLIPDTSCPHVRQRAQRATNTPIIHYGLIASGNRVVKNAAFRDQLTQEHGTLCFEMEAAGIINTIDCLVIRGICDYCDGAKNDTWQEYAAATAAAYAKLLLGAVAPVEEDNVDDCWRSCDEPRTKKRRWIS